MKRSKLMNISLTTHYHTTLLERSLKCTPSIQDISDILNNLSQMRQHILSNDFLLLLSVVTECVRTTRNDAFTPVQLSKAIASLDGLSRNSTHVQQFLHVLAPKISHNTTHGRVTTPKELAVQLGILRHCRDPWVSSRILHSVVTSLGASNYNDYRKKSLVSPLAVSLTLGHTTGYHLSQLMFNLQAVPGRNPELHRVLDSIAGWVRASDVHMTPPEWSRALCGLSKFNTTTPGAINLLTAISEKMFCASSVSEEVSEEAPGTACSNNNARARESSSIFTPKHLSQAMYGLRYMDSKHPAVMIVIRNITRTIQSLLTGVFEGKDLARVLYGLKNMSSQEECVRELCWELADKMSNGNIRLSSLQNIDLTMACRGMEKLSSERIEVRQLLRVLASAWRARQTCPDAGELAEAPFTGQMVSQALFGLQLMDNRHEEVEMLLRELVRTMRQGRRQDELFTARVNNTIGKDLKRSTYHSKHPSTDSVNMKELSNALYGLRSMSIAVSSSSCAESSDVVEDILNSMDSSPMDTDLFRDKSNLVESILKSVLDRSGQIRHALALAATADWSGVEPWLEMEPMHMAHALYGLQHLGPDHQHHHLHVSQQYHPTVDVDHTADVVALLCDVQETLSAHARSQSEAKSSLNILPRSINIFSTTSNNSDSNGDDSVDGTVADLHRWTPYRLHDCFYGLLAIDFDTNDKARRLLSYLLKITKALALRHTRTSTHVEGGGQCERSTSEGVSFLKLYQTLLMLQGKAIQESAKQFDPVNSSLTMSLYNRLSQVITLIEGCVEFPPLENQHSRALQNYKKHLQELLDGIDSPTVFNDKGYAFRMCEDRRPRNIKAFFNTYLHGFHADIVLVGYYTKENKAEMLMSGEEVDDGGVGHSGELPYYSHSYISGNGGSGGDTDTHTYTNKVPSELETFIRNTYSPNDLIVVNVEIDGQHKSIAGNHCRDMHRDAYLRKKYNVAVTRVDLCEKHKLAPTNRLGPIVDTILDTN